MLLAPVAGTILKHVAREGAEVKVGETVLVMESMKMELELKATVGGKVHFLIATGIKAAQGQPVAEIGKAGAMGSVAAPPKAPGVPAAPHAAAVPAASAPAAAASGGSSTVPAPVAGTVLKLAVAEGATVNAGDNVVIMESMKMELEIKATSSGKVHFLVAQGAQVASQQPLAEVSGGAAAPVQAAQPAAVPQPAAAPQAAPVAQPAASSGSGETIPAPVAGTVLKLAVEEGANVKSGDNVVIMESMKMELEIKATSSGKVHFLVAQGAQVASQQPLAELK
jgi:oxaloacetate decarboxylase alpha subunit